MRIGTEGGQHSSFRLWQLLIVVAHGHHQIDLTNDDVCGDVLFGWSEFSTSRKPAFAAGALFSCPTYSLPVRMMRRCRGCRTVKRVNSAWLGNTAVMMHYRRIVNSRGSQWAHG